MKKPLLLFVFVVGIVGFFVLKLFGRESATELSPLAKIYKKPLEAYTFNTLKKRAYAGSAIQLGKLRKETDGYLSYMMYFVTGSRKVSGFISIPKNTPRASVIVLIRGYVDKKQYKTGIGSEPVGTVLANNGYIVVSPDFLGYGDSDAPSKNPLEERFQTYTTTLDLLASLRNLTSTLKQQPLSVQAQTKSVGIWAHSNGGHIALSVLAISGGTYPTVLWAPVSKPFPYSILYYTDDSDDHGRAMRKLVASFERDYDSELYSTPNYLKWIHAPIQLHQGTADTSVPLIWSDELYTNLKKSGVAVDYFTYNGADHNLSPNGWSSAVERALIFYGKTLR